MGAFGVPGGRSSDGCPARALTLWTRSPPVARGAGAPAHFPSSSNSRRQSKELCLPPEPGVPWPPTPDLTGTQGPPVASQPGVGRRGGCGLMFPAEPLCPRWCISASPLGLCRQSVPSSSTQAQEDQALPATVLSRGRTQMPALGSVRPAATATARTSPRGLC